MRIKHLSLRNIGPFTEAEMRFFDDADEKTHSPFIISSVPDARLFVCKVRADHCVVVDETSEYSNKPVDEILISPLFEGTLPFNEDISRLIKKREQVIRAGNRKEREQIETKLKAINPQYFSYFDVDFGEAGPYPELVEG